MLWQLSPLGSLNHLLPGLLFLSRAGFSQLLLRGFHVGISLHWYYCLLLIQVWPIWPLTSWSHLGLLTLMESSLMPELQSSDNCCFCDSNIEWYSSIQHFFSTIFMSSSWSSISNGCSHDTDCWSLLFYIFQKVWQQHQNPFHICLEASWLWRLLQTSCHTWFHLISDKFNSLVIVFGYPISWGCIR